MHSDLERQYAELRSDDHLCQVYESAVEQFAAFVPFAEAGLARGERFLYVAPDHAVPGAVAALEAAGVDVRRTIAGGGFGWMTRQDAYFRSGKFDPSAMLDFLRRAAGEALADGFVGLRLIGEMTWILGVEAGLDRVVEFEALVNDLTRNNLISLCQYDRRRFDPALIRDMLRTHPIVVLGDLVCPNLYYEPPRLLLSGGSEAERSDWMIQQLKGARQQDQELRLLVADHARLLQQEQRRRRQLEAFRVVAAEMTSELDLTTLLRLIVTEAAAMLESATATIHLLDATGQMLMPQAWHGHDEWLGTVTLRLGEGVAGTVAQQRTGLIVNDYRASPLALPFSLEHSAVTASLAAPIMYQSRLVGVIALGRDEADRPYTNENLDLLTLLADEAATAIENARLYLELAQSEQRLHELVGRLLLAQEEERRRVAYDVHDGLAQVAAATNQHLRGLAQYYRPRSPRARQGLDRALELAQQTVDEARRVIAGLRPTTLDDFGLEAAVRLEVEGLRAEGWEVAYEASLGSERLPWLIETALFRVCQEALSNVRKHTAPGRVRVTLTRRAQGVRLEVRDWGPGFEPAEIPGGAGPAERVGLASMRERVALLGGTWTLRSRRGAGTRILVEVPLSTVEPEGGSSGG